MGKHKHTIAIVLVVYLIMSFVPQIGLMQLLGKKGGKGKKTGG